MTFRVLFTLWLLLVAGYLARDLWAATQTPPIESMEPFTVDGPLTSPDVVSGEFMVGRTRITADRYSELHGWLTAHEGQQVHLTFEVTQ